MATTEEQTNATDQGAAGGNTPPAFQAGNKRGLPLDRQLRVKRAEVNEGLEGIEKATLRQEFETKFKQWNKQGSDLGSKIGAPVRRASPEAAQTRSPRAVAPDAGRPAAARQSGENAVRNTAADAGTGSRPEPPKTVSVPTAARTANAEDLPPAASRAASAQNRENAGQPVPAARPEDRPVPPAALRPDQERPPGQTPGQRPEQDRLQRNQRRADEAVRSGNSLVDRVARTEGAQKMAEQAAGQATSQVWYWGFGAYFPTLLIPGTLVMDFYWLFLHRRNKELFPMPGWQKAVTVACNFFTVFAITLLFFLMFVAMCSNPVTWAVMKAAGAGSVCDAVESAQSTMSGMQTSAPSASTVGTPSGPSVKVGNTCYAAATGPASVANLSTGCFGVNNAPEASAIAYAESGGNALSQSRTDICTTDGSSVSFGLFQINISAHKIGNLNCPSAFNQMFTASTKSTCRVINQSLYQQCVQAAKDAATNIQVACQISGNGSSWSAWGANLKCGF